MARGSIVKRTTKDGKRITYVAVYRLPDGKQKWESVGSNKKEAERVLARRLEQLNSGTYAELKSAAFAEFGAMWLEKYARPRLKESTYNSYERHLRIDWIPSLGATPLAKLTTGQIEDAVGVMAGRDLAPKSINNAIVVIRLMLKHAVRWGYLTANPAEAVERVRVEKEEMRALTPDEVKRLLAASDERSWLLLTLAVFTGLRRGELLALQWRDINFVTAQITVQRSVWRGEFIGPKTKNAIRKVDLAPAVVTALREAKPPGRIEDMGGQLVFSKPNGKPLEPDNMVKWRFKPALRRAELPPTRFHDLRHTYASLLIAAGEHPKYVQSQLGHASITTTLDRYGHLLPGAYAHAGERLQQTVLGDEDLPRP